MKRSILLAMTPIGVFFSLLTVPKAYAAATRPAALMLASSKEDVTPGMVEFYQEVARYIDSSKTWVRLPQELVVGQLRKAGYYSSLGSVPLIQPKDVERSNSNSKETVIPAVQVVLDSMAVPASVIAQCRPVEGGKIAGCSLYFYDRNKQKITASVDKTFAVPVTDVTRWAPIMVKTLASGIEASERRQDQEAFENLLNKSDNDSNKTLVTLAMLAEQSGIRDSGWNTLPQIYAAAEFVKLNKGFGIEGSLGKKSGSYSGEDATLSARSLGLAINYTVPALDSLLWDLGLGLGYKERSFTLNDSGLTKKDGAIYFSLRPGLYCQATSNLSIGLAGHFTPYMTAAQHKDEGLSDLSFSRFSAGLSIGARFEF